MRLTDDELILHYYGESENPEAVERALASSAEDRRRFEALRATLDAVSEAPVPEPSPFWEARTWARLEARLEPRLAGGRRWPSWLRLPAGRARVGLGLAGVLALLLVVFLAGRQSGLSEHGAAPEAVAVGLSEPARERILAAAVAEHLERSERLLVELENGSTDVEGNRDRAAELKIDNRLYRLAAHRADEGQVVALLDDLERFLLELSHASPDDDDALEALRQRLVAQDLLFRVRVTGTGLEPKAGAAGDPAAPIL